MADSRDYYDVLGVNKSASDDEIKKAEEKLLDYNRANSKFQGKGR